MGAGFCRKRRYPRLRDTLCKQGTVVPKLGNFLSSPVEIGISSLVLGITDPVGKERVLLTDALWRQCQDSEPFKHRFFFSYFSSEVSGFQLPWQLLEEHSFAMLPTSFPVLLE